MDENHEALLLKGDKYAFILTGISMKPQNNELYESLQLYNTMNIA